MKRILIKGTTYISLGEEYTNETVALSLDHEKIYGTIYRKGNTSFDYLRQCGRQRMFRSNDFLAKTGLDKYKKLELIKLNGSFIVQPVGADYSKGIQRQVPSHIFPPTKELIKPLFTYKVVTKKRTVLLPFDLREKIKMTKHSFGCITVNNHGDRCCLEVTTATSNELENAMDSSETNYIYGQNAYDFDGVRYILRSAYSGLSVPIGFTGPTPDAGVVIECWYNEKNRSIVIEKPVRKRFLCDECRERSYNDI